MVRTRFLLNPHYQWPPVIPQQELRQSVRSFHAGLPGYQVTPLHRLPDLAERLGLADVWLKDESLRLGLPSFKILGASYAMHRLRQEKLPPGGRAVWAAATDGNHGRAVAWMARQWGDPAVIFVPAAISRARRESLEAEGAEVVVVKGSYDLAVSRLRRVARRRGWLVVSDTAWPGFEEVPGWIMKGYQTLFEEIDEQLREREAPWPQVCFLQVGVGSLAAAGISFLRSHPEACFSTAVTVEPLAADCLLYALSRGRRVHGPGPQNSIMSGLNCGIVSWLAWPVLKKGVRLCLAVSDLYAREAVRVLYQGGRGRPSLVAGEAGAGGVAGLIALCTEARLQPLRRQLGLNARTSVLCLNTEGATDPAAFQRLVMKSGGSSRE